MCLNGQWRLRALLCLCAHKSTASARLAILATAKTGADVETTAKLVGNQKKQGADSSIDG